MSAAPALPRAAVRIRFGPPARRGPFGSAADAVHAWLADLARLGHVATDRIVARDARGWFAVVTLLHAAPLPPADDSVRAWFASTPRCQVLGRGDGAAPIALARCRRLLVWAGFAERDDPVRDLSTGRPVPLAALPIVDRERRALTAWAHTFASCDALWFGSDVLERAAGRELGLPGSRLLRQAAALARVVEAATGLPTFRYLVHQAVRGGGTPRCPACRRPWRRRCAPAVPFPFRCDACRLVAHAV